MLMPGYKPLTSAIVVTPTQPLSLAIQNAQWIALEIQSRNVGVRSG